MMVKVIDGSNLVLGRMASVVAGELLKGYHVQVVNAEKVVITGNKKDIVKEFRTRMDLIAKGNPFKGPKNSRLPDRIVKDCIEGMLPRRSVHGRSVLKNLQVDAGLPLEWKGKELEGIGQALHHSERKVLSVGELSRQLGARE